MTNGLRRQWRHIDESEQCERAGLQIRVSDGVSGRVAAGSISLRRRLSKAVVPVALWSAIVMVPCIVAHGQSITNVEVTSKTTTKPDIVKFTLKISGRDFGTDKGQIKIRVSPQGPLIGGWPTVDDLSADGTIAYASFTAPSTYDLSTVTLIVGSHASDPYVLAGQGVGTGNLKKYVKVYRSLLDPKTVADIFGRRVAQRFVVIQVTITNRNTDFQFLIHDISLDLTPIMPGGKKYEASSADLSLLRGVAEKGQSMDGRNLTLRILRGAGSVAAGLLGVTTFGSSYAPAVAVFNGPAIAAFSDILPDYTINQMNRLNDSAYAANTIVPKQQSKVVAIFLPQSIFLNDEQRKEFWKDPTTLWTTPTPAAGTPVGSSQGTSNALDLRRLEVMVDGNFITNVEDLAPTVTAGVIEADEMKKFQGDKSEVAGTVSGSFLSGSDITLLNKDLPGVGVRVDSLTDQRLGFVVTSDLPLAPGTVLKLGVIKNQTTKEVDVTVQYTAALPTLTKVDPAGAKQGDKDVVVALTGTNFLPAATQVVVTPAEGITVGAVTVKSSTSAEVKITVADAAPTTAKQMTVVTPGGSSSGQPFAVTKK